MKTSERGSGITLTAILSFPLRYFLLPVLAALALGGCAVMAEEALPFLAGVTGIALKP